MTSALEKAFELYRTERVEELHEIADILNRRKLTPNNGPLYSAAAQCKFRLQTASRGAPNADRKYWGFKIIDLQLNLEDQYHLRPRSAVMKDAIGVLSVVIEEYVPNDAIEVGKSYELLRKMYVDFHLDVFQEINGDKHDLRAAWHIDTHPYEGARTHGVHPKFHFQVGGDRFKEIDDKIRGVLLPEAPRLPCAPLDAILAIDFVLSHYCSEQWDLLKDIMPSYLRLRKNPMQRYWSPYFRTLAEGIDKLDSIPNGGNACTLIPSIFCG
jgi:hypothetical protein